MVGACSGGGVVVGRVGWPHDIVRGAERGRPPPPQEIVRGCSAGSVGKESGVSDVLDQYAACHNQLVTCASPITNLATEKKRKKRSAHAGDRQSNCKLELKHHKAEHRL